MMMELTDIEKFWEIDSTINPFDLGNESLKIPKLHSKYYKIFLEERAEYLRLDRDYKRLRMLKQDWLDDALDEKTLNELKWERCAKHYLKAEYPARIDNDPLVVKLGNKILHQKDKLEFVESIIKSLRERGFQIKAAIDWERFKSGA